MMKKSRLVRRTLLALLAGSILMFRFSPEAGEWYARSVYPSLSFLLSGIASLFSFSLCEVFVLGVVAFLLVYPWLAIRKGGKSWKQVMGTELELLVWVGAWFYWSWGLNYFRKDIFLRSQVSAVAYDDTRFHHFLAQYADRLNASFVPESPLNREKTEREIKRLYWTVPEKFGLTLPQNFQHPKHSIVNSLYSSVGVLGYMGPFFSESHLNHDLLPVQYPFTYAHELSHLLGVSSEAEANFWAYRICTRSADPAIRYSGYFGLLPYVLVNARNLLPESEYLDWVQTIRPEIIQELSAKQDYWSARYNRWLGELQAKMYDFYLKGNRISSGRKNYAEVIGMILAFSDEKQ